MGWNRKNMNYLDCNSSIIRGSYTENFDLSKINRFRTGGLADVLFRPEDTEDLANFLKNNPDVKNTIIGGGSNLLIRDGGIKGVVIKLGSGFRGVSYNHSHRNLGEKHGGILVETGALESTITLSKICQKNGVGGLEFLSAIPGTVGGAISMNAGAFGNDMSDIFVMAEAIDENGAVHLIEDMGFKYRGNSILNSWIITKAIFRGEKDNPDIIAKKMSKIISVKNDTQPVNGYTGGSTFKNPQGEKAWKLIDEAGCRGLNIGGAVVSEKHCNFLVNTGNATSADIENLGEKVRKRVNENSGIDLEWEIKLIGIT